MFGIKKKDKKVKNETKIPMNYNDFQTFLMTNTSEEKLSTVYKCIELISDSIGKIPFYIFDSRNTKFIEDHELSYLIGLQPNEYQTKSQFFKYVGRLLLTKGDVFILPIRDGLKVESLRIVENVSIIKDDSTDRVVYQVSYQGKTYIYRPDEIIHIMNSSVNGYSGRSVLENARDTIITGVQQQEFAKDVIKGGSRPTGNLIVATDLSNKTVDIQNADGTITKKSYKDLIRDKYEEQVRTGKTTVLDNGMRYEPVEPLKPTDIDFVNTSNLNALDIARFFKVPPSKLGVGSHSYNTNEQEGIAYVNECVKPYIDQISEALTLGLLPRKEIQKGYRIYGDVDVEVLTDATTRSNYYRILMQCGAITPNEVRKEEKIGGKVKKGDVPVIGPNYLPLGTQTLGKNTNESEEVEEDEKEI